MKKLFTLLFLGASLVTFGQPLTGTKTIPGDYSSIAAAVTALNTNGVGTGGVTFNVAAGYTETIAAPIELTATGTSTNPIVFQKSGSGSNPLITAHVGTNAPNSAGAIDGIWRLVGSDYVTINGISLMDPNTTEHATMEYGFGFFKASGSDGCQYNVIKNCIISMQNVNDSSGGTGIYQGSVGIAMYNVLATAPGFVTVTAASGSNSYNQIIQNTIQGAYGGIALIGFAAPSPFTLGDMGNDIGGSSSATGNIIKNFGSEGTINAIAGVFIKDQWNFNVSYNTIINNDGGGVNAMTTLRGIFTNISSVSASGNINYNLITLKSDATGNSVTGIEQSAGSTAASNTINIIGNILTGFEAPNAGTTTMYGINNVATPANLNILNNNLSNFTYGNGTSTTGTGVMHGIWNSGAATNINISNNSVTNFTKGSLTATSATGAMYPIYNSGAGTSVTVYNNLVDNITRIGTTGATIIGIYVSSGTTQTVKKNTVSNIIQDGLGTTSTLYGIQTAGTTVVCDSNTVTSLSVLKATGTSAFYGIYNGGSPGNENFNYNVVSNLTHAGTGIMYGIYFNTATGVRTVSFNQVYGLTTGGTTLGGIHNLLSSPSVYSNQIYNLQTNSSGNATVFGIGLGSVSASGTASIYNNMISDLRAPAASGTAPAEIIRGINITMTTASSNVRVYSNTVFLNATSSGANFGSSGIYHTYSATATSAALDMRNNIVVNTSTPNGAGNYTTAFRRSAATSLANVSNLCDNNCFYAGSPSSTNLIFFDGTNADQTISAYQTRVAPREVLSFSMMPNFINSGSAPYDLHISTATSTMLESGGQVIAAVTNDIDGNIRYGAAGYSGGGTAPDIGADEFEGLPNFTCVTPAPGNTLTTANNLCLGTSITLSLQNPTSGTGVSYQWKYSSLGVTYSNITGATQSSYSFTPQADGYYLCEVTCQNGPVTVASTPVLISFVSAITSTQGATRCGVGTVVLTASGTGSSIDWFGVQSGGTPLATGNTFTTPVIGSTTSFFASSKGLGTGNVAVGDGASTSATYSNPFYSLYSNIHTQHLITAAELVAAGINAGNINSVALDITSAGTLPMIDLSVQIGTTTATTMASFVSNAGFQVVYTSASLLPTTGLNVLTFSAPFYWDGVSNIVLEFCHGNSASTATMSRTAKTDATSYVSTIKTHATTATAGSAICGNTTSNVLTYSVRPQFIFNAVTSSCYSPRVEVVATVTPPPVFSVSNDQTICSNTIQALSVTSALSNFDTYVWTPVSNLFTDPAATIPYVANTNASTVYFTTAVGGSYTYTCNASNVALCANVDDLTLTVLPASAAITSVPAEICVSGAATLSVSPATGYGSGTLQWQSSADNITFADIAGANSASYVTPTLTATTYYKVVIKDGSGNICLEPGTTVVVNNPQILSTTPGARCGTGTVSLQATASTGTTINWYSAATGGTLLGTGNSFTTPVIGTTTNYYAEAGFSATTITGARLAPTGTATTTASTYGLVFDAYTAFTLNTVDVYPTAAGNVVVNLQNSSGTVLQSITVPVVAGTVSTPQTLTLNFNVPAGTGHRLIAVSSPSMVRESSLGGFPYSLGAFGSITNGYISGTSTTYYYFYRWVMSAGCASPRSMVTATVTPSPVLTISANQTVCNDVVAPITVTSNLADFDSYVWTPAAGLFIDAAGTIPYVAGSSATTVYARTNIGGATTYTCTGTNSVSLCANTATSTVTVKAPISITATATPDVICVGGSSQLNASAAYPFTTTAPATYTFAQSSGTYTPLAGGTTSTAAGDDGTQTSIPIGFTFNYNGADFSTFGISTNGTIQLGTTATSYTNALASNANVIAPLWDDNNLSAGSIKYMVSGSYPFRVLTIDWNNVSVGGSGSTSNSVNQYQIKLFETSNIVQFEYGNLLPNTLTASIGISGASGNYLSVTPGIPATASSATENAAIASVVDIPSGTVYTFTPGGSPVYTYAWSPSTFITGQEALPNPFASGVTTTTTYTVAVTTDGCTANQSVILEVSTGPNITQQPVAQGICAGAMASFTVTANGPGLTYQWRKDGVDIPAATNATAITANLILNGVSTADAGTYDVVIGATCGLPVTSAGALLTIKPVPTAAASSNSPVCEGSALNLSGTTDLGTEFSWTGPLSFSATTQNASIATLTLAMAGDYTFLATLNGCTSAPAVATVVVNPQPSNIVVSSSSTTICNGSSIDLSASSTGNFFNVVNLLDPTGNGGFASGGDFASNGWTVSNSANNPWVVGTAVTASPFAGNSVYISKDAGVSNTYDNTLPSLNYFYRDVTVPAGATNIKLSFNWIANGESGWDLLQVFTAPTSITPVGSTTYPGSGTSTIPLDIAGATLLMFGELQTTVQNAQITLPISLAGTTFRLIFAWKSDDLYGTDPSASIDNIAINASLPVAPTYTWSSTPAGFNATGTSVAGVTPTQSTTYTVNVQNGYGCSAQGQVAVTVNPLPTANTTLAATEYICPGDSLLLTVNMTGTAPWTITVTDGTTPMTIAGLTSPTWTYWVKPSVTTTYSLTNISDANCSNTSTLAVTVDFHPVPAPVITGAGSPICVEGSAILDAGAGYSTYLWSNNSPSQTITVTGSSIGAGSSANYSVTVSNVFGCKGSASVTLSTYPALTANAGADAEFCQGFSTQLDANGIGGAGVYTTYTWSPAAGLSATNVKNPVASPSVTTTYTVTIVDGNGCTATDDVVVTYNPLPVVSLAAFNPVCIDQAAFALSGGLPLGGTYSGIGVSSNNFNPASAGAGIHTISYTYTDGESCTNTATSTIQVNPLPIVTLSALADVCIDAASITLSGGMPVGGTYSGTGVSGGIFNPGLAGAGTHIITYTYTDGNSCTNFTTGTITVNALPILSFAPLSAVCIDAPAFTLSGGSPTGGNYSGTGVSANMFNAATAGAGTHIITYTYTDGNACVNSITQSILVNALPVVSFASLPAVCVDAPAFALSGGSPAGGTYSGTGVSNNSFNPANAGVGTHSLTYTYTDGNSCTNAASTNIVVNPLPIVTLAAFANVCVDAAAFTLSGGLPIGGTYTGAGVSGGIFSPATAGAGTHVITYTYTDGNTCTSFATANITVNALPAVSFAALSPVCIDAATFALSGGSPAGGFYSGTGVTAGMFNPAVAGVGTHTITYTYTDGNSCVNYATTSITVNPLPVVTFASLTDKCVDAPIFVLSGGSPLGGSYTGTGVSNGNFNPTVAGVGTHTITYTFTNGNGCTSSATSTQTVNPLPVAVPTASSTLIPFGTTTTLNASATSGSGSYSFVWAPAAMVVNATAASTSTVNLNQTQNFTLVATDVNTGCVSAPALLQIGVFGGQLTSVPSATPNAICVGNSVQLDVNGSGGAGVFTFNWTSTPAGFISSSQNPVVSPTVTTTYTAWVNDGFNTVSADVVVTVYPLPTITFSGVAPVCVDAAPFTLGYATPAGGLYTGNGINAGTFNPAVAGVGSHVVTYTYTDVNTCTNSGSFTQVVNPLPVVTLGSFSSRCIDAGSFVLTGGMPTGGTYSGTGVVGNTYNPGLAGSGTHVITYTYTDGNSCTSSASSSIIINPLPVVTLAPLAAVCIDAPIFALSGGSPMGGTYSGPGVISNNFNAALAGAGTHTIAYTFVDGNGCLNFATQTITVNPLPVVSMGGLPTLCVDAPAFALSGGLPAGGTYSGPGVSGNTLNPAIAGAGFHQITYTFTNSNGCTNSASTIINLLPLPTVLFNAVPPVCVGDPAVVLTQGFPAGGTYSGPAVNPYLGTFHHASLGAGTYTLTYTYLDPYTGCDASANQTVTVNPLPAVTLAAFAPVCVNAAPFGLTGGLPAGGTYTGMGVMNNMFYPATAGVGTHQITYTYTSPVTGCTSLKTVNISVQPLPAPSISGLAANYCITAGPVSMLGTPISGGLFSGAGVSGTFFYPSVAGVGIHTITYTSTSIYGCSASTTATVTVNALPTVSFAALPDVCVSLPAFALSGGLPLGGTYSGPGVSAGNFNPATAGVGLHTITYSYTNMAGCSSSSAQTILVNPLPIVTFSPIPSICIGNGPVSLTQGFPVGGTYSGPGVNSVASVFNPTAAGTFTLTYTYTDGNGCTKAANQTITVNPLPLVSFTSPGQVCIDAGAVPLSTGTPAGGVYSGPGVTGAYFYPNVTGVGTFTLTYTYTDPNTGCTNSTTNNIYVNPLPVVTILGLAPTYCLNNAPVALNGTPVAGGVFFGPGVSNNVFYPSVAGPGSHTITYSYSTAIGCTNTASQTVFVYALPTVSFAGPLDACINAGAVALTGGSPNGGVYSGFGVNNNLFSPTTAGVGAHVLTYTYTNVYGCSNTATQVMVVNPLPQVSVAYIPPVCEDAASFNLTQGAPAGGVYTGTGVNSSTGNFNPSWVNPGTYTITYTYTNPGTGCTNSATGSVTVNALPVVTLAQFADVCVNATPFALGGGVPAGGIYSGTGVSNNVFSPAVAGTGAKLITYTYSNPATGCTNQATKNIYVNPLPSITFGSIPSQCANSGALSLISYATPLNGTFSGPGIAGNTFNASLTGPGTFTLTYTKIDGSTGCSNSATAPVVVNVLPNVTFGNPGTDCINNSTKLLNTGAPAGGVYSGNGVTGTNFNASVAGLGNHPITYTYTAPATGCSNTANAAVFVYNVPNPTFSGLLNSYCVDGNPTSLAGIPAGGTFGGPGVSGSSFAPGVAHVGTHSITYSYTSSVGCTGTTTKTTIVYPDPVVFLGEDTIICINHTLVLDGGAGMDSYLWSNGKITRFITLTSADFTIGINNYWVKAMKNGCDGMDTIKVTVNACTGFDNLDKEEAIHVFPNPNSGQFDLVIQSLEGDLQLGLYDAIGKLISAEVISSNLNEPYHRSYDLSSLPSGVYYIKVSGEAYTRVKKVVINR
jgi:hypothetical protein